MPGGSLAAYNRKTKKGDPLGRRPFSATAWVYFLLSTGLEDLTGVLLCKSGVKQSSVGYPPTCRSPQAVTAI